MALFLGLAVAAIRSTSVSKGRWRAVVACQETFTLKGIQYVILSCVPFLKDSLLSVPGKQERAELRAVLKTEIIRMGTCLDSLQ